MFECIKQLLLFTPTAGYQLVLLYLSLRKETCEITSSEKINNFYYWHIFYQTLAINNMIKHCFLSYSEGYGSSRKGRLFLGHGYTNSCLNVKFNTLMLDYKSGDGIMGHSLNYLLALNEILFTKSR